MTSKDKVCRFSLLIVFTCVALINSQELCFWFQPGLTHLLINGDFSAENTMNTNDTACQSIPVIFAFKGIYDLQNGSFPTNYRNEFTFQVYVSMVKEKIVKHYLPVYHLEFTSLISDPGTR